MSIKSKTQGLSQLLTISASLCTIIGFCYFYFHSFLLEIITKLPSEILLISLLILISYLIVSVPFVLKKKPNLKDYEQINPPGYMQHKVTGKKYCQPCLIKLHRKSELSSINEKLLMCRCCNEKYGTTWTVV